MISVIVPTADRAALLPRALQSIEEQTYRDLEVIVVNDGGAPLDRLLQPWRERLPLVLIERDRRAGPASARNAGLDRASGDLIAFLDDDDVMLPNHLEVASTAICSLGCDFVYFRALVATRWVSRLPPDWERMPQKAFPWNDAFLLVANYIHTGSVVVRSFRETPVRFNEVLSVCEDWDLWIALTWGLGYRVSFIDELTTVHHRVPSTLGLVARAKDTFNEFGLARKHIESKWTTEDPHVNAYRAWFAAFEDYRDERCSAGARVRDLLFDDVLQYLYPRFVRGEPAERGMISRLFDSV